MPWHKFAFHSGMRLRFHSHETPPFHVIGKCDQPHWPVTRLSQAWELFGEVLDILHNESSNLTTHAFVLMSNHYHWLCTYDCRNDSYFFEWFHESVSFYFFHKHRNCEKLFEKKAEFFLAESFVYYKNLYRYVYKNPVSAGLVDQAEDYPFSTLFYLLQGKNLDFPCFDNMNLIVDPIKTLNWINGKEEFRGPGSWMRTI